MINDLKIAIYGAGSLGTILGAYITKNNVKVDLINRNKAHIEALKANGAKIVGTVNMNVKVNAIHIDELDKNTKYDVIFLLTKQQDNKNVAIFLKDFISDMKLNDAEDLELSVNRIELYGIKKDDVLIVPELSRIARSIIQILEVIEITTQKGIIL